MNSPKRYIVDPPQVQDRVDSKVYTRVAKVMGKWEHIPSEFEYLKMAKSEMKEGFCGNIRPFWIRKTKKFKLFTNEETCAPNFWNVNAMFSEVLSSAMLLYRLLTQFPAYVRVETDRYKCIWWITLKHKATGEYLQFGEWKGAAGTWTRFHTVEELPKAYARDLVELCNELAAPDLPHPYDGTVAGSVA